jgi:cell division septation protein DedD
MTYDLALDKKAIISLIAGSVVIAVLLFVAGLIVGRQWPGTDSTAIASAKADNERATVPTEPVLNEEAATPPAAPQKPKLVLPKPAEPAAPTAPVAAPGSVPPPQVISEAETENADQSAVGAQPAEPDYVTVQVGVFLDEKEAGRLLQQMENKGYRPTFFSGRDAESRQWYAVRIGVYSDRQQATNAAANFTKQEKMKAIVRPVESL